MSRLRAAVAATCLLASGAANAPVDCSVAGGALLGRLAPGETAVFSVATVSVRAEALRALAACAAARPSACAAAAGAAAARVLGLAWAEVLVEADDAETAASSAAHSLARLQLAEGSAADAQAPHAAAVAASWALRVYLDPLDVRGAVARAYAAAATAARAATAHVLPGGGAAAPPRLRLSPFAPALDRGDDDSSMAAARLVSATLAADALDSVALRCHVMHVAPRYPAALAAGWALYAWAPALAASLPLYYGVGFSTGALLALGIAALLIIRHRRNPALLVSGVAAASYAAYRQVIGTLLGVGGESGSISAWLWEHSRAVALAYVLAAGGAVVTYQYVRGPIENPRLLSVVTALLRLLALALLALGASASGELAAAAALVALAAGSGGMNAASACLENAALLLVDSVPCLACCTARCAVRRHRGPHAAASGSSRVPQHEGQLPTASVSSPRLRSPPATSSPAPTAAAVSAFSPEVALQLLDLEQQQVALQRRHLQLEHQRQILMSSGGAGAAALGGSGVRVRRGASPAPPATTASSATPSSSSRHGSGRYGLPAVAPLRLSPRAPSPLNVLL